MIRVVLDANVVASALINPQGMPAQVFDAWRAERFQVVLSPAILEEIGRVLRYPKIAAYHRWSEERLRTWLLAAQAGFEIVVSTLTTVLAAVALFAGRVIVLLRVEEMAAGRQEALAGIDMLRAVGADV